MAVLRLCSILILLVPLRILSARTADTRLYDLIDADWGLQKQHSPVLADLAQDRRSVHRWPDLSPSGLRDLESIDRTSLARLHEIDAKSLSKEARLYHALFERNLRDRLEEFELKLYLTHFFEFHRFGPHAGQLLSFVASTPSPASLPELKQFAAKLDAFPTYVSQQITLMRQAQKEGMLPPREMVQSTLAAIGSQLKQKSSDSAFYKPLAAGASKFASQEETNLLQSARESIVNQVVPALRQLHTFLSDEYLPSCPESPSLSQWRNGRRIYAALVRRHTTTRMSPEEIHEIGASEVARIRQEMTSVLRRAGSEKSVPDFLAAAGSDQRFYFKTRDELLTAYRSEAKRIEPTLVALFRTFPRMPFGVEPSRYDSGVPAAYAPPALDGSRAGIVRVAVNKPELRSRYEITALMLHEGVPGHHLQMSLERERSENTAQTGLSARQYLRRSDAFTEGWALYAESLGDELGLYADPYNKFGQLSLELLRAARLVADTGIHFAGWSRERAKRYFLEQTGKPDAIVESELSRAVENPGSLLGYKVGELRIRAMRTRTHQELGQKFDIREFHDFLLRTGPLPLDTLDDAAREWLQALNKNR